MVLKSNQHGYTHGWEILINIYQSSIKTIGCFYIYLSRFVIAIHSTLGRRNANFGQELMSFSVFIWQVSIDHTFGSHIWQNYKKQQRQYQFMRKPTDLCTNAPFPQKSSGRAYVHRKEKIMHHSKNERINPLNPKIKI